jgi:hypothetical protein
VSRDRERRERDVPVGPAQTLPDLTPHASPLRRLIGCRVTRGFGQPQPRNQSGLDEIAHRVDRDRDRSTQQPDEAATQRRARGLGRGIRLIQSRVRREQA